MLPDIVLDNEEFEEILNEAINTVISLYPSWTDFNAHDPGITLLELFAVMKESQQFFLDQIGEENKKKYLKLLGMKRRRKQPAHSLVQFRADTDYLLLSAHKMDAGGLCFETGGSKQLVRGDIFSCMAVYGEKMEASIERSQMESESTIHFWVFGKNPRQGSRFYICFEESLPVDVRLDLYMGVYQKYEVQRNPLQNYGFIPLVHLEWRYYTAQGWKVMENVEDETYAFLFDGFIRFRLEKPMEQTTVSGRNGCFLCVVLKEGEYDVAPVLTNISMNLCDAVQQDTLVECLMQKCSRGGVSFCTELCVTGRSEVYIGKGELFYPVKSFRKEICEEEGEVKFVIEDKKLSESDDVVVINRDLSYLHKRILEIGNGFPYQEIDLEDLQAVYESFEILVQDTQEKDGYRFWKKVEDFATSSPEDRHYIFDSQKGVLRFGDCIHGMAPEGQILLAGYQRTMGSDGNVKTGKINRFLMEELEEISLSNICDGHGGCDEETLEECFFRARQQIREADCAVTIQDYERYVRQTPGLMIESCKVLRLADIRKFMKKADEMAVYMVVKPYGFQAGSYVQRSYYRNIKVYLENFRMIGSRIVVFFPEYVEIEVYVEAVVKPQYLHIRKRVWQAVKDFFDDYRDAFGSVIACSRLYGFLDSQDFIWEVRSLHMDSRGNGVRRTVNGDILLSPYGVAVLSGVRTSLTAM